MSQLEDTTPMPVPDAAEVPQPHRERRRKRRTPKWLKFIRRWVKPRLKFTQFAMILTAVVVVVIVGGLALATESVNRVRGSLSNLGRVADTLRSKAGTELTLNDFDRLQATVKELSSSLQVAQNQLAFLRFFSGINTDLRTMQVTVEAAMNLSLAADTMLDGLQPTLFFMMGSGDQAAAAVQISSGERIVELLQLGRSRFDAANRYLNEAKGIIDHIDLASLSSDGVLSVQKMTGYHEQLQQMNNVLLDMPDFLTAALGLDGTRHYLILAQNSDELRPSGGYISTWGWMSVRDGRVEDYEYSATTPTSPRPPSPVAAKDLTLPSWWLQNDQPVYAAFDGSWYADFPSTAGMAMWFYNAGHNDYAPVDGVIAIDIMGFEAILKALGSVVVPGYSEVVTPENFRRVVYDIRSSGEGDTPHKRFLAALYKQLFTDWQKKSADPQINTRLLGALLQSLQEKHVMLYFADARLNDGLDLLGWSGAQAPATNKDYLLVADANLGNKSNHSIIRSLTYDVEIQPDGSLNSRATVAYDYSAAVADQDPAVDPEHHGPLTYSNLFQVFVPQGSLLVDTNNLPALPVVVGDPTHTIFVSQVFIPYDSSERFQFSYVTKPLIENLGTYRRYRLLLQKQPGTLADRADVQLSLPSTTAVISTSPDPTATYKLDRLVLEFRLTLTTDQWVEVVYRP